MSEANDSDGKKSLTLSRPRRLELKKTVETGQVRQSFSHGRSKSVTVEVRKKRTFTRKGGEFSESQAPQPEEIPQEPVAEPEAKKPEEDDDSKPRVVLRSLTGDEKAARARALADSKKAAAEARVRAEEEAKIRAEEEAKRKKEEEEAARRAAEEEERKRVEDEARRKAEDDAARRQEEEQKQTETVEETKPDAEAAKAKDAKPAKADDDKDARAKAKKPGRQGDKAKPAATRRDGPRRRGGKLTIDQALADEDRQRSLASVRRAREREKRAMREASHQPPSKVVRDVVLPESITVQELANRMAERAVDVIKELMKMGVMANFQQTIDADTAELVVSEFGHRVKRVTEADVEQDLLDTTEDDPGSLESRAPVVTVMGHVDHGKTSLLDALRQTDVAGGEAGGITQHIGAYQVETPSGHKITFIDTPGHAAFSSMRARGAKVTDIVILVVAADDGIMPQTVEAISHAKAAEVPIIVAINKMDKPEADPNRVRNELLQHEIVVEGMGGEVLDVEVSAIQKTGLDKLEEAIILQSELLELKANPERTAEGTIVEAKLERGRGSVATVLVTRGTVRQGDVFVAGAEWGRVRALIDDHGRQVKEAGPATPVEVLGFQGTPEAGDDFTVVESESRAREVSEFRQRRLRQSRTSLSGRGSIEQMFSQIQAGEVNELPVVIKSDVQGSTEAIIGAAEKLGTDEVSVRVLHGGVGGINESDITLAKASNALVIGFNVRANKQAKDLAEAEEVDIRYYSVIYDVIDAMKGMLSGMLKPEIKETFIGNAEIREVFSVSKVGKVAGCLVTDGIVRRGAGVRLLRDNVVVHEGKLSTLKRFKDDVKEVRQGTECGMSFENYHDIQVGDVIEAFEVEEVAREL